MDSTLALFLTGLCILAVIIWRMRSDQVTGRRWTFSSALNEFDDVVELVRKFAPAADQLVKIKELDKADRRAYVVEMVKEILPNVSPELVILIVEWWIAVEQPELKKTLQNLNSAAGE